MDGGVTALDIESMARYWSQDAENYGNIIQDELASFRVEAWQKLLREKMPADPAECWIWAAARLFSPSSWLRWGFR